MKKTHLNTQTHYTGNLLPLLCFVLKFKKRDSDITDEITYESKTCSSLAEDART